SASSRSFRTGSGFPSKFLMSLGERLATLGSGVGVGVSVGDAVSSGEGLGVGDGEGLGEDLRFDFDFFFGDGLGVGVLLALCRRRCGVGVGVTKKSLILLPNDSSACASGGAASAIRLAISQLVRRDPRTPTVLPVNSFRRRFRAGSL